MDYEMFEDGFSHTSLGAIHFKHHPGTGEKLIFLHGLGGTTLVWKRLMEEMPDDLDIYLIDLLGHGESDAPDIDYTVSAQFQVLREFISLNNNGNSYLFGHSYGAWVAAYYATQPYTCNGLILEDSAGVKEEFEDAASSGTLDSSRAALMKAALEFGANEHVLRSILYSNYIEDALDRSMLSNIKQRTMLLWGANDSVVPLKYGMILNSEIKGSALEIINDAGHEPHYEKPKEVADAVSRFVSKA